MQRTSRTVLLTFVFSLLMLGMQLEGQRHALQHVGDRLHRPHEQGLQLPQGEMVCAECALLAGTSNAVATSSASTLTVVATNERIDAQFLSQSVAAPAYYSSRAPPVLL
jgi:CII-binding regulator of phage lambda lysogenization HflD